MYRKVNTKKEKVEWLKICWLQVSQEKPFQIRYQYSHNPLEVGKTLDVCKKRQGRPLDIGGVSLSPLFSGFRPINVKKLQDLHSLMEFTVRFTISSNPLLRTTVTVKRKRNMNSTTVLLTLVTCHLTHVYTSTALVACN